MPDDDDFEIAKRIATRALTRMDRHRTAPNPRNFQLFYNSAAGANPSLQRELEQALSANNGLSPRYTEFLHRKHLRENGVADKLEEIGKGIGGLIRQIKIHLKSPKMSADALEDTLDKLDRKFDQAARTKQYDDCFELITNTARQMQQVSDGLQANLSKSEEQIDRLDFCLETVCDEVSLDWLTGIPNRAAFDRRLAEAIDLALNHPSPLSLLMIDIDNFKNFNDEHGHQVGDAVLRFVASTIRANTKGQDMAARYGGEEFAVILPETNLHQSLVVAEKIRQAVGSRVVEKKSTAQLLGRITVSIGAATLKDADSAESFVERADHCLYEAKKAGRNNTKCQTDRELGRQSGAA